jgi:uncharacterized protein YkwD
LENKFRKSFRLKNVATAILAILSIAVILFFLLQNPISIPDTTEPDTNSQDSLADDSVPDSSSETYSHDELMNYALSLINSDRQSNGLQNVTLSEIPSGQQHADNMLNQNFYSHWDLNGYKPYMRYTLAGGQGSVSENIAWMYSSDFIDPKEVLPDLQWEMMYNDADSGWGHRDNILDSFHNKVSIGISYNDNNVYFVQDFEDDYISWDNLTSSNDGIVMKGAILQQESCIQQVAIYYDNPMPLTTRQLGNPPYDNGYDVGVYVGLVVSPPPSGSEYQQPEEGILIIADSWTETVQDFDVKFEMSTAFAKYGNGVYTLYLWADSKNYLTTYSVWYEG